MNIKVNLQKHAKYVYIAECEGLKGHAMGSDPEGAFLAIGHLFQLMHEQGKELPFKIEEGVELRRTREETKRQLVKEKESEIEAAKRVLSEAGFDVV
jgi:hypothetical protein